MAYLSPVQFANSNILGTTLNGAILAGDNTLTLASQAVLGCPTTPSFDLLIENELITVNGIAGNVCTPLSRGSGGTTAAGHATGVPVYAPITLGMVAAAFARSDQANPTGFQSPVFTPSGLYAAVATTSRIVGAVAPGLGVAWTPTGGPYNVGDEVFDVSNACYYLCTVAGTPGTWIQSPSGPLAQTWAGAKTFTADVTIGSGARLIQGGTLTRHLLGSSGGGWRDSADSIDLLKSDATGLLTARNALTIPPSVGGTAAATSYGTVPIKFAENLLVAIAATVTFSSIPQTFRNLRIDWYARSDTAALTANLQAQLNGITTATYDRIPANATATWNIVEVLGATSMQLSRITGATATANYFGQGEAKIKHYAGAVGNKYMTATGSLSWGDLTGQIELSVSTGKWRTAAAAVTSLALLPSAGNFIIGSLFTLWLEP